MANPKIEVEIGARITELDRKLDQVDNKLNQTGKSFKKLNEFAVGALQGIAAAFTIGAVVDFGRAVLDTTAKFQKFSAVLTNTLGSNSAAKIALNEIVDFASKTPFQVDEITGAFVKLANQGFRPTVDQLRSLGDLSASVGASFDQVAEAIIDAQVGEFERLKAFGIRASKEGDNVTFTFKNVETTVKATSSSIRDYILSLGELNGVAGATAAISATVGGQISNLEDNITKLKAAIGDQSSGVFAASLDWLNSFVETATLAAKSVAQIREEASLSKIGAVIESNRKSVIELGKAYQEIDPNLTEQAALAKAIAEVSRSYRKAAEFGEEFRNQQYTLNELEQIIEGFNGLSIELLNVSNSNKNAALSQEEYNKFLDEAIKKAYEYETAQLALIKLQRQLDPNLSLQRAASQLTGREGENVFTRGIVDVGVELPDFPPIKEIADTYTEGLGKIKLSVEDLSQAFAGLGSLIGSAFNNPQLGNFLGQFAKFVGEVVAGAFAVAKANAVAGATQSSLFSGPAAAFTLPAFIASAVGLVASAFAGLKGFNGSGRGRSVTGVGVGAQTFGGSGLESSFINGLEVTGLIEVDGTKLLIALENATKKRNRG